MDSTILNGVVMILERIPLHIIMMAILKKPEFKNSIARAAIIQNTRALAHLLFKNPDTQLAMQDVAFEACIQDLMSEIMMMGRKENGWHFSARNTSPEKIREFSIMDMSRELKTKMPQLWQVLSAMLVSDPKCESERAQYLQKEATIDPSEMMVDIEGLTKSQRSQTWDEEDEYWVQDADGELETKPEDNEACERPSKQAQQAGTRNSKLVQVVRRKLRVNSNKALTIYSENCHDRLYSAHELKSEV